MHWPRGLWVKKKINSRQKGASGERELAAFLREHGYEARRGVQFSGSPDSPDVVTDFPFHVECKRVEALSIYKALAQASRDAGDQTPLVCHRRSRQEWVAILKLEDLITILKGKNDGETETETT